MLISWKHLFILIVCLSWMEVNFLLIHFDFCYDLFDPILYSKTILFSLNPVGGLSSHFLPLMANRIFVHYFVRSCFVCILLVLSPFLFSLPSFASAFWLMSSSCILCCWVVFSSLFQHLIFFNYLYHYHYFSLLRVFLTSITWYFSTVVWVTACLLKSSGLFSVFWPISIML